MFASARTTEPDVLWIDTMIGIQLIDWFATIGYLIAGDVTFRQVSTASFMPVVFIGALLWFHPRRLAAHAVGSEAT